MAIIDFILNLVALAFWLSWLAVRVDTFSRPGISIMNTLRKADPTPAKRWRFMIALGVLLVARAFLYRQFGGEFHAQLNLNLGVLKPSFRTDYLTRMLVYSLLSFGLTLGVFYMWLLLLSVVNSTANDKDPWQKTVRAYFRTFEGWPVFLKLVLPFFIGGILWLGVQPLLGGMSIVPRVHSFTQLVEQAAFMGVGTYLAWKYLIVGVLLLHLFSSYLYLGNQVFWHYINITARQFMWPLRWIPLRIAKVDFLPLIVIAIVFFISECFCRLSGWSHHHHLDQYLPF